MANKFGGEWTREKLECVRRYLEAYATVMKKQSWVTTWYIDAFAGDGYVRLREQEQTLFDDEADASQSLLLGSALRSLEVDPPFDRFEFIERSPTKARNLNELCRKNADLLSKIRIRSADANDALPDLCRQFQPHDRGVLFLDPFAMNVDWATLEAVAATERLDVWYLVSISAVNRMLPRDGWPTFDGWEAKLTRFFGTTDWKTVFYPPQTKVGPPSLFDGIEELPPTDLSPTKAADYRAITAFILQRLKSIFRGGVAENPKVLLNDNRTPMFLLCFAVANPNPKASSIALDIAQHILEMP